MSIVNDIELAFAMVGGLEQIVKDAEDAEQSPEVQKIVSDIKTVIAKFKTSVPTPTPDVPVPVTPPPAA